MDFLVKIVFSIVTIQANNFQFPDEKLDTLFSQAVTGKLL